ncbi:YceH family protein [Sphingobacterium hungaricum]|uniref:DUF480 domain-containing protein n=1 Tax=Sphingobacterium hungaricum TaxID=2082723 RepID=A0A928V152_9SPHI|nr:YceH family protein [Sphingobacterium hungaricum]MBE8715071.1 DUF480 domain-containing protein [Sphingobacterium hungaricum]
MEETNTLPQLSAEELRIIGCLIEKSKTTPEYYPMTLNSLQTACNQKSSRKPVVNYSESTIVSALDALKRRGLISTVVGGGSRVTKYKHNVAIQFPLLPQELAILCLLILRGPLTAGEINSNAGRLYDFENLDEVQELLIKLSEGEVIYIKQLSKRPGQKEVRYVHLFAEVNEDDFDFSTGSSESVSQNNKQLEERVQSLEEQLAALRQEFDALMQQLS